LGRACRPEPLPARCRGGLLAVDHGCMAKRAVLHDVSAAPDGNLVPPGARLEKRLSGTSLFAPSLFALFSFPFRPSNPPNAGRPAAPTSALANLLPNCR